MTWKKVNNSDVGDATHFGGNDYDKMADLLSDVVNVDTVAIDSTVKLVDSKFTVRDNSDLTKAFRFECSGITTGTTRVITVPNVDFTPVTIAETETITGVKTFGSAGAVGKLKVAGTTSGSTIIDATAVAGSGTVTLPTTGTLATLAGTETLSGKTLTEPKFADLGYIADANGNELLILDTVASAVNELKLANSATATPVLLTASGETNVSVQLVPKGTGTWFGNRETFSYPLTDETTLPTTGVKYVTEPSPYDMTIEDVIGGLTTAGTGATLFTFDILKENSVNANAFTTIFTTKPTIDASEFTSTTGATPMVLSVTTWEKGRRLQLKIDTLDSNSLGRGAKLVIIAHATAR